MKSKSSKVAPSISRLDILNRTAECLCGVIQWNERRNPDWASRSVEYYHRAEVLIELLEVQDCGSIGGFDGRSNSDGNLTFFGRFDWIVNKYHKPADLKLWNGYTYNTLKGFFDKT